MGGGRGLSMRQLATDVAISKHLSMTNVDLFDYGFIGLEPDELTYLENLIPDVTHQLAAPHFILANAETVLLPEPADLITSVQVIQYLNNPLAAISNWYNQLADNGLLIISTEHDWASWIRYQREPGQGDQDEVPTKHLLQTLKMAGVSFATSDDIDSASGYRPDPDCNHRIKNLVIQKAPNTQLIVNSPLSEVWVNHYDFKAAYYAEPGPDFRSIVEIIKA
jgi:SAM-dependent methyltransferase